jgi:hypothetical protein
MILFCTDTQRPKTRAEGPGRPVIASHKLYWSSLVADYKITCRRYGPELRTVAYSSASDKVYSFMFHTANAFEPLDALVTYGDQLYE